ncbi:MAG TPA: hypothetical protein VIM33_04790 [Gaiellaceae bacterium]
MTREELVGEIEGRLLERLCVEEPQPHPEVVDVSRDVTGAIVLVRQSGLSSWGIFVLEVSTKLVATAPLMESDQ